MEKLPEFDPQIEVGSITSSLRVAGEDLCRRVDGRVLMGRLIGDRFVFCGGAYGVHSLDAHPLVTPVKRLLANWHCYCRNILVGVHVRVGQEDEGADSQRESWAGQVARVERIYSDGAECSWQPSPLRPRRRRMLAFSRLSVVSKAEHILRACAERGSLVVVGTPQEFPSAQEVGAVVVRMDVECPAVAGDAESIFRDLVSLRGLRIIGVPEAAPSEQDPGVVLLRVDVRVPAALIEGPSA